MKTRKVSSLAKGKSKSEWVAPKRTQIRKDMSRVAAGVSMWYSGW